MYVFHLQKSLVLGTQHDNLGDQPERLQQLE
jgi:hypothetical protein